MTDWNTNMDEAPEMEQLLIWVPGVAWCIGWFEDGTRPGKYARGWWDESSRRQIPTPTAWAKLPSPPGDQP
jgi:hypothetical protein